VDRLDFRLLVALHQDARLSLRGLGRQVGLSAPAVRARMRRLEERGILQGFWVSVRPGLFGRENLRLFFRGDFHRADAVRALLSRDVAWVAWKLDGGLAVHMWPTDREAAIRAVTDLLHAKPWHLVVATPAQAMELSPLAWRVMLALLDNPRVGVGELAATTGLSPKTVRRHLKLMKESEAISILPKLGTLGDSGDVVYHVAVAGPVSMADVRRSLGDAFVVHETTRPRARYLLCRADNLGDAMLRSKALGRCPGVESVTPTLNLEMFVSNGFVRGLIRDQLHSVGGRVLGARRPAVVRHTVARRTESERTLPGSVL
jgi:DNA-binding Lrp family transcriptional regulator